jgi:membrane glycosyltransferase
MGFTARQKRTLGRELRDVTFRLCSMVGGFLGLLWDLHHQLTAQRPPGITCHAHGSSKAMMTRMGHCIGSQLSSAVLSWLIPIVLGLLLGVLVGVILASTIRLGRTPDRPRAR